MTSNVINNINIDNINIENEKKIESKICDSDKSKYVIHEILNPLSVISNCTELLSHQIKNDDIQNKKQMLKLLSIIKKQIKTCSEISECVLSENDEHIVKININEFIIQYINEIHQNNSEVNIYYYPPKNVEKYYLKSCKSNTYLKVIFDNIVKNTLKHNDNLNIIINPINERSSSRLNYINCDCDDDSDDDNSFEIIISGYNSYSSDHKDYLDRKFSRFTVCKNKNESNLIGMEIIDKFCSIMNINWDLSINPNNLYQYRLSVAN